ncbi:MAG TPA: AMP-binding protein [Candidatus Acidoferrum sp.]|jgi:long-chain acyl-CoA synthetase|nr:AMP-binding protein [Candidatus Acidoferrum sp.]
MPRENLLSLFAEFELYARDVAVVQRRGYRREVWTYKKLAGIAVACALELKQRDVRTGDRVLLWGPNDADWVAAFWGCLLRGAIAVPMDDGATPEFAGRVARDVAAKLIFHSREKPPLDPAIPRLALEDLADTVSGFQVVAIHQAQGDVPESIHECLADEPLTRRHVAQILFTSGTTAEPRGVVLTHGNFLANLEPLERGIEPYRKYERWFHPLRFVSLVPLSHVFGQFMALFVPPLLGATVVFEASASPSAIIRTIKSEQATALIAVPRMLDVLRGSIKRDFETNGQGERFARAYSAVKGRKFLRRAWRFRRVHRRFGRKFWAFISGGAALSGETEEFFKRMGYAVVQGYGMTETASLISLNHPFRATQGSIGKILPGREFRLAGDGEILVRGENVSAGYWERGALRQGMAESGGWLRTGDVGELDAEGNLRFRGRKKNVIVTPAGLNVYPEDLEAALRKQPGVRDCVVVLFERGGNAEPFAVLLVMEAEKVSAEALIAGANASLAEFQKMQRWVLWPGPDFPRTPTGKPRLNLIAARAAELLGGVASSEAKKSALEDFLEKFSIPNLAVNHLERTLNLSSLDRVELMSVLEQRFQVELNETSFANARTAADIERLLQEPAARRSEYIYPRWTQSEPVRWVRLAVYYALVWPATQILAHPKIVGSGNLRGVRGPVLVISNHITRRADIGLILAALPLRFRHRLAIAMGGETLQNMRRPPQDWFFPRRWAYQLGYWLVTALFNVFPLPQHSGFRESFRFAGESADRGYSVLVFPEGEVNNSESGEMAPLQGGIGLLAENLRLPIVPMRLDGVWQMKRDHRRLAHFGEITVRIGAPVTFAPCTPAEEIARKLESLVRAL